MATTQWTHPGERRRHVTIQQQSMGSTTHLGFLSGSGGALTTVLTTWAKVTVKQVPTLATVQGDQPLTRALYILNIRYAPSTPILPGMHVTDGAITYVIQNVVDVDERHRELNLFCALVPTAAAPNQ